MPTGKVCCLYCYLASLYKRSLQANNVFLLLCIRGDKCASVTHDQWVRVRSIVSNIVKTCDRCTQRSTTRHFCHCTPTHKHVLLMILHMSQGPTCRRFAHTSLILHPRRDTGARICTRARQPCARWARCGRRVIPMPTGRRRTELRPRLERSPPLGHGPGAASGAEGSVARRSKKKVTIIAPLGAASSGIVRRILRMDRWCRALRMGTRGAEVQECERAHDAVQGAGQRSGGIWGDYLQRGLS